MEQDTAFNLSESSTPGVTVGDTITSVLLSNEVNTSSLKTMNITSVDGKEIPNPYTVYNAVGVGIPPEIKVNPNTQKNKSLPFNDRKWRWEHLTLGSLLLIILIVLSIGLSLDGYISKIFPDVLIGLALLAYMIVVYNGYVNQTRNPLVTEFIKVLQIDTQDPNKRKILYFLTIAISMTPGYVLSHGYVTSGPPGFFPSSIFPLLLIIATLLLTLRDCFLRGYWAFNGIMWIFLIEMIATSQIPSRPESSGILTIRVIYTFVMSFIAVYILFRYILRYDTRIRNVILSIILFIIVACNTITLAYQGGWVWKNYLYPTYEMFPHDVIIGALKGYYLPIVSRREYRYNLIPVGSTPYHTYINFNSSTCTDYPPSKTDDITLSLLWLTSTLCHPLQVAPLAQGRGYDAVIFSALSENFTQITVAPEINIQLFVLNHQSLVSTGELSFQYPMAPITRTYTVITREENNLWSKPSSYLILISPILIGLTLLIFVNMIHLRTSDS